MSPLSSHASAPPPYYALPCDICKNKCTPLYRCTTCTTTICFACIPVHSQMTAHKIRNPPRANPIGKTKFP